MRGGISVVEQDVCIWEYCVPLPVSVNVMSPAAMAGCGEGGCFRCDVNVSWRELQAAIDDYRALSPAARQASKSLYTLLPFSNLTIRQSRPC